MSEPLQYACDEHGWCDFRPCPKCVIAITNTPRTDAEEKRFPIGGYTQWIKADFARQLERELAQAVRERDEALKEIADSLTRWTKTRTAILKPANCGVAGHFEFQENGGHCMLCQDLNHLRNVTDELAKELNVWFEPLPEGRFHPDNPIGQKNKAIEAYNSLPHVKERNTK